MQILSPVQAQQLTISPAQGVRPGLWSVGQLLQASVTGAGTGNGLAAGSAVLRIGGQEVLARAPGNLQPGTQLNLRVLRSGQQPLLQIVTPSDPTVQVAAAATRVALPRQGSLVPLLSNLFTVAGNSEVFGRRLPEGSIALVKSVLATLPELSGLRDGAAMQRAIAGSGIFLEAKLAALIQRPNGRMPGGDLKAALLKLVSQTGRATVIASTPAPATTEADSAKQTQAPAPRASAQAASRGTSNAALTDIRPGEEPAMVIKRQAEAGLARIQLNQLTTLSPESPKGALWTMDIPIRDGDQTFIARLTIEKDQQQAAQTAQRGTAWTVALEFDLPELGPIHARLSLSSDTIDTRLWAERTDTLELMRNLSEGLRQRLTQAGFAAASVAVYPGKPNPPRNAAAIRDLIDLQA